MRSPPRLRPGRPRRDGSWRRNRRRSRARRPIRPAGRPRAPSRSAAQAQVEADRIRKQAEAEVGRLEQALGQIAETRRTALGLVMNLGSDYLKFEFDKAELRPEDRELLSRIAGILATSQDYTGLRQRSHRRRRDGGVQPEAVGTPRPGGAGLPRQSGTAGGHPERQRARQDASPRAGTTERPAPRTAGWSSASSTHGSFYGRPGASTAPTPP